MSTAAPPAHPQKRAPAGPSVPARPVQSAAPAPPGAALRLAWSGGRILQRCACGGSSGGEPCATCKEEEARRMGIQRSALEVRPADDPWEREADRAAAQVVGGVPDGVSPAPVALSRVPEGGGGPGTAPPSVHRTLGGSGRPLDAATRAAMEMRFGQDFGDVRVHTGADADRSAREVRAAAYTVGSRVVFGAGRYRPESGEGRRLLAHELAHVVQQRGGRRAVQRAAPPVVLEPLRTNAQACVVHVHGNEPVALRAAKQLHATRCVNLAWIDNAPNRLISVDVAIPGRGTRACKADPNRIFDNAGVTDTLRRENSGDCVSTAGLPLAEAAVQAYRDQRLNVAIRQCRGEAATSAGVGGTGLTTTAAGGGLSVLAMHNNARAPSATPPVTRRGATCTEDLSIRSYLPGHCEGHMTETDPARLHGHANPFIARPANIDEFILVTDDAEFDAIATAGNRNVVLQIRPVPGGADGSLSVALSGAHYANVEAIKGGALSTNLAMGNEALDALGVSPGPCAPPAGGSTTPGAGSTAPSPSPGATTITSARVPRRGSDERTRFARLVYDRQVAIWTARGAGYVHSIPAARLVDLRARDRMPGRSIKLERTVARGALEPMMDHARRDLAAARAAGTATSVTDLRVRSGYRSATEQLSIWIREYPRYYEETAVQRASLAGGEHGSAAADFLAAYVNERVFSPGYSPHQRAQTVDVTYEEGGRWAEADTTPAGISAWNGSWFFAWLQANARSYGFVQNPDLNEPWHWEYDPVGVLIDEILELLEELLELLELYFLLGEVPDEESPTPPTDAGPAPEPQ